MRRPAGAQATRPLRIAMIGSRGVPARWGGIERHVEELGALLVERGHHVTVFCRSNYVQERVPEHRGVRLRQLPTISTKHLDAIVHSGLATSAAMASSFDILHYHALGPGVMGVLPRFLSAAKVVQTVHGLDDQRAKWGRGATAVLRTAGWLSGRNTSVWMKVSQAWRKAAGVFFSPKPYTISPSSRSRCASRVKSLSLVTRQKPSKRRVYIRSIASMISDESVAFLPLV